MASGPCLGLHPDAAPAGIGDVITAAIGRHLVSPEGDAGSGDGGSHTASRCGGPMILCRQQGSEQGNTTRN